MKFEVVTRVRVLRVQLRIYGFQAIRLDSSVPRSALGVREVRTRLSMWVYFLALRTAAAYGPFRAG